MRTKKKINIRKSIKVGKSNKVGKTRKKVNIQKGGTKLGSGKYGCVVKPYVKCNETDSYNKTNHVSKLFIEKMTTSDLANELSIYKIINSIDKNNKFFITYNNICELKQKYIRNRNDIVIKRKSKNNLFNNNKESDDKYKCYVNMSINPINMIMEDGGMDLTLLLDTKNSKYLVSRIHLKENIQRYLHKLLNGIKKLHMSGIIHKDIKPKNILFKEIFNSKSNNNKSKSNNNKSKSNNNKSKSNNNNNKSNSNIERIRKSSKSSTNANNTVDIVKYLKIRYIDFGLADNINMIKSLNDVSRAGTSGYKSPDIICLRKIITTLNSKSFDKNNKGDIIKLKKTVVRELKEHLLDKLAKKKVTNKSFNITSNGSTNIFYKDCIYNEKDVKELINLIYKNYRNGNLLNSVTEKVNGYLYKFDIYSLGVLFYVIVKTLDIENKDLMDLIKNMLRFNPEKRYNVNQCLNHRFFNNNKN